MIVFYVKGQTLKANAPLIVENTVKYLEADVRFMSAEWADKVQYLHAENGEKAYSFLLHDGRVLPSDGMDLTSGEWVFSVVGEKYNGEELAQRITTETVKVTVNRGGSIEGEVFPDHNPSLAEQFLARVNAAKEEAKAEADRAEGYVDLADDSADDARLSAREAAQSASEAAKPSPRSKQRNL